ncbi:MAG: pyruvate kinase [Myxococcales bacterium]|nr:pyruvate kinase [Myxococcales bacterium]
MTQLSLDLSRIALIHRRTKIIATVGPSSRDPDTLGALIDAGVDVFRLNFSHGTHEQHAEVFHYIRQVSAAKGSNVAVLADLCGPKIRVGHFVGGGIDLRKGEEVTVTVRQVEGEPGLIPSEYAELSQDVSHGDKLLLDDGKMSLEVQSVEGTDIQCKVLVGGRLTNRKGLNLPGVNLSTPALTPKDREDARFAAKLGVDFFALSFVRHPKDIEDLQLLLREEGVEIPIIAKIEKPEAVKALGPILEVAQGIMIARGDLGVEMPAEEVPLLQEGMIRLAIEANRQVIVATQMMESMIQNPRPTRAEVTDVAAAAMAGTDAVMLSAETAAGQYPLETVETMGRVLRMVEGHQWQQSQFGDLVKHPAPATAQQTRDLQISEAIARGAAQLSRELSVRAIVVPAHSGHTAEMIACERPAAPILAASTSEAICRRLSLCWGVRAILVKPEQLEDPNSLAREITQQLNIATEGQFLLYVSGGPPEQPNSVPVLSPLML